MDSPKIRRSVLSPTAVAGVFLVISCLWIVSAVLVFRHITASDFPRFGLIAVFLYLIVATMFIYGLLRASNSAKQALEETDATRRNALSNSEAQYRLLFDSNPLPMWVFDRVTHRFLAVNDSAISHYGYSREEFLNMNVLDIQDAEEADRVRKFISDPSRGFQPTKMGRHRKKDGSLIDVEITSHDLNFHGADAGLILAHDVTTRMKSERRLLQSQEKFSKAFGFSPLGIIIIREADGRFLDVNPAFLKIVDCGRDEIVGRTVYELDLWPDPQQRSQMLDRISHPQQKIRLLSRTGKIRSVEVAAGRIQLDDESCILAITHDVTETSQLEQKFLQAQKMEAVGRLAAGVAHDFNNMLGVIIGYSELAKDRIDNGHPAHKYLLEIKTAGDRAVALTRQLLAFSRQQVLEPRNLNLNSVVHHASKMLLHMIGEDISLVFRPTEPLGSVHADLSQIEQVLMNLAVNARDAMPKGGKIIIETANIDLDETCIPDHQPVQPGPYVMLSVTDTGTGMDEATLAQAFEPFFTTKEPGQGTGLGLSTVYGIAKQSGGYVTAYSEANHGTTFKLYLPRAVQPAERLSPLASESATPLGSETVLVAEDEPALRNLTVHLLKSRGYTVLSAENAARSLAVAQQYGSSIDLLLTDVVMPDRSGPDLVSEMRKLRPELKVLYMSGYSKNAMIEQGVLGQDSMLIIKPFSTQVLLSKMRAVLES